MEHDAKEISSNGGEVLQKEQMVVDMNSTATGDSSSTVTSVADGEYHQLLHSLDDDVSSPLPEKVVVALHHELSSEIAEEFAKDVLAHPPPATVTMAPEEISAVISDTLSDMSAWYGHPLSKTDALNLMPEGSSSSGLVWNVTIVPDQFLIPNKTSTLQRKSTGLNHRDFISCAASPSIIDQQEQTLLQPKLPTKGGAVLIKPRRPSLPVSAHDFSASLTKIDAPSSSSSSSTLPQRHRSRYIFHGVLNGWPGLRTLELISLEYRRGSSALPSPRELFTGQILWLKAWSNDENDDRYLDNVDPLLQQNRIYRAKLRGPPWTALGWSPDSLGFCFWYEAQCPRPRVTFGTRLISELAHFPHASCTMVHMISHRYAVDRVESPRDRLTYHSVVLLEWDHGLFCTVIETAYLNGMGGYKGKSNWYDDKDAEPMSSLYQAFPPEMICPWRTTQSEIRCYDVMAKNLSEFRSYMARYECGPPTGRFIDVRCTFSHAARLTFRSKVQIAQYLLNYILRDSSYGELNRNCQTFAADLCSFLAGKRGVAPFHPVNRIDYQNRTYLFLYDSHLYEKKRSSNKK